VPAPAWGRSSHRPSRFSPTLVLKQQRAFTLRLLVVMLTRTLAAGSRLRWRSSCTAHAASDANDCAAGKQLSPPCSFAGARNPR
jgi:hypothetical protein